MDYAANTSRKYSSVRFATFFRILGQDGATAVAFIACSWQRPYTAPRPTPYPHSTLHGSEASFAPTVQARTVLSTPPPSLAPGIAEKDTTQLIAKHLNRQNNRRLPPNPYRPQVVSFLSIHPWDRSLMSDGGTASVVRLMASLRFSSQVFFPRRCTVLWYE